MVNRIEGQGLGGLQALQAQRAFRPAPRPLEEAPVRHRPEEQPFLDEPVRDPSFGITPEEIRDIQTIAKRAGYVGLTESAIQRAYSLGESLLADYHA